mgnify:CR=1 FL=1
MAYVAPNSTLQLFKGINLDNRYLHTIYFANATAQDTWFTGKVFKTYNDMMYRRYTSEAVKVEADATELLGVTYMRFRNTRTASKWFYAFVLGVDYVNENTAVIYYEIDVMQTWFIQGGSIRPCMVLREHTNNDIFGTNLEHEPIGSEEYSAELITNYGDDYFGSNELVIKSTGKPKTVQGQYILCYQQGLFDGTLYSHFPMNNANDCNDVISELDSLLGSWDAGVQEQDVISMYTVPSFIFNSENVGDMHEYPINFSRQLVFNGYIPKNNKLHMYPFSYLLGSTHDGSVNAYKWENFHDALGNISINIEFHMVGTSIGGGQIMCFPRYYDGQADNFDAKLIMDNFPKNAFNYDAYQAWIASGGDTRLKNDTTIAMLRGASQIAQTGTDMISAGGKLANAYIQKNLATGMVAGGVMLKNPSAIIKGVTTLAKTRDEVATTKLDALSSVLNTTANIMEAKNKIDYQWKDASYRPNFTVGESVPNIVHGLKKADFYFYHVHIKEEEIKRLDDFLSCYGYATNKVKQPNLTGRSYWNFVQTDGAVIAGDMPSSSKEAIGRIFDGGITFWHNGDNVGNYAISTSNGSINNPIV